MQNMLEYKSKEWDYRVLPNKMYELVRNTGSMYKESTGYLTDAESEMLTVLQYLNDGEKTNITESMIEQINEAIRSSNFKPLFEEEVYTPYVVLMEKFIKNYVELVEAPIAILYVDAEDGEQHYLLVVRDQNGVVSQRRFDDLRNCRAAANESGFIVRLRRNAADPDKIVEAWI